MFSTESILLLKQRIKNLLISWDQLIYVHITLGAGDPDETLSSAAYRADQNGKILGKVFRPAIDFIFSGLEKEHCKNSYLKELAVKGFFKKVKT